VEKKKRLPLRRKKCVFTQKIDAGDENRQENVLAETYPQQAQRNDNLLSSRL